MKRICLPFFVALLLVVGAPAFAELQTVQIGGEVRIGANHVMDWAARPGPLAMRIPAALLPGRAIGDFVSGAPAFNGAGILSPYAWDDRSNSLSFVEQRTRLNVRADFTDCVVAFVELESYDVWGEDFRSNYITGADMRAASVDDLEVYQAYIEASEMWDMPLRARIGRQELSFGSEWLVGPKDFGPMFMGRSFDAVRLTYGTDVYDIDVWSAKLVDTSPVEEDGDVDFYGVYGTCRALENVTFDAYWLFVRDGRALNDTNGGPLFEWVEDVLGLDDYDVTELHTVGLRAAGAVGAFDFGAEAAYQLGDAGQVGFNFKPWVYGDDDEDFSEWALKLDVGYTFDVAWNPRVHAGYSYYGGEDNRDLSFWEWINPFDRPEASVSFNRLFSNHMYNGFFDLQNELSNVHIYRIGANLFPTECLSVHLDAGYFEVDEPFAWPVHVTLGRWRIPIVPFLPFLDTESDDDLGVVTDIVAVYNYSSDLSFLFHWSHLFADDGVYDGSFVGWNGLLFNGGTDDDDGDYFRFETRVKF
ncbi:MAG TPA: alginate export family protein [Candidatus Hydrogenedentes bacterium]|nr:alginate export family protein [Candidatus Hydrogenedentota bacterium]